MKSPKLVESQFKKNSENRPPQNVVQFIWGIALTLMGIGVIFRIPVVIEKITTTRGSASGLYFLHFCFYLIAIILMGGGIKKITGYLSSVDTKNHQTKND